MSNNLLHRKLLMVYTRLTALVNASNEHPTILLPIQLNPEGNWEVYREFFTLNTYGYAFSKIDSYQRMREKITHENPEQLLYCYNDKNIKLSKMTTHTRSLLIREENGGQTLYIAIRSRVSTSDTDDIIVKYGTLCTVSKHETTSYDGNSTDNTTESNWTMFKANAGSNNLKILERSGGDNNIPLFHSLHFSNSGQCSLNIVTTYNHNYVPNPDRPYLSGSQDINYTLVFNVEPSNE